MGPGLVIRKDIPETEDQVHFHLGGAHSGMQGWGADRELDAAQSPLQQGALCRANRVQMCAMVWSQ